MYNQKFLGYNSIKVRYEKNIINSINGGFISGL